MDILSELSNIQAKKSDYGKKTPTKPESVTKFFTLSENNDNSDIIENLVKILQRGGVIAIPTDTLYGIACLAQCTEGIEKVYEIKGRDWDKPIAICVGEVYDVCHWGNFSHALTNISGNKGNGTENIKRSTSPGPVNLLNDLLPGPVTIVTERTPALNQDLNPKIQQVGIRVPDHQFVRDLANRLKEPLALTSANISSETSSLVIGDFQKLHSKLDAVVDGGKVGSVNGVNSLTYARDGSTVVRLFPDGKTFKILRTGCAYSNTVNTLKNKWDLQDLIL